MLFACTSESNQQGVGRGHVRIRMDRIELCDACDGGGAKRRPHVRENVLTRAVGEARALVAVVVFYNDVPSGCSSPASSKNSSRLQLACKGGSARRVSVRCWFAQGRASASCCAAASLSGGAQASKRLAMQIVRAGGTSDFLTANARAMLWRTQELPFKTSRARGASDHFADR